MEVFNQSREKRIRSGRFPRSVDVASKLSYSIGADGFHTVGIPHTDVSVQFKNHQCKRIVIGKGKNVKVCFEPVKKKKISFYAASHSEIKFDQAGGEGEREREREDREKSSNVINIKLDMTSPTYAQSASKTRTRFISKPKIHIREITKVYPVQRKTLIGYGKTKQNSFLHTDPQVSSFLQFQPIKKQDKQFFNEINKKLLHIEKMKPIIKGKEKIDEKRITHYLDNKFPNFSGSREKGVGEKSPSQLLMEKVDGRSEGKGEEKSLEFVQVIAQEKSPSQTKERDPGFRKFDLEICSDYILAKKGFIGRKDYFVFGLSERPQDSINKIECYRDFLWKVNFSNNLFVEPEFDNDKPYRVYIGRGNNSMLVRGLMKRRFWWVIVDKPECANFSWTQLKIPELIGSQPSAGVRNNSDLKSSMSSKSCYVDHTTPRSEVSAEVSPSKSEAKRRIKSNTDSDTQKSILTCQKQTNPSSRSKLPQKPNPPDPKDSHSKIFNDHQLTLWRKHNQRYHKTQQLLQDKTYIKRSWLLKYKEATKIQSSQPLLVTNHFMTNTFIGNKKALFYSMRKYYQLRRENVFKVLPVTFHISAKGVEDPEYQRFLEVYKEFEEEKKSDRSVRNIWIAKPGEFTNRGTGISVCASLDDIKLRLRGREKNGNGTYRTFILQKYIEKPLLYNRRKFDIRHYILISCINGNFKGYWYQEGYLRTSSYEFSTKNYRDPQIHLTNDAIQKHNESYGKFQKGNKLSYQEFQKYLDVSYKGKNFDFFNVLLPKMKGIAQNAIKASYFLLDTERKQHNFEIFGLDFMIDQGFNPWLIQVNTNPCLELGCPLLARLIPGMVQNALKIGLDPLFPPPVNWGVGRKYQLGDDPLNNNRFQLIFDESVDGPGIMELYKNVERVDKNMGEIEEEDEQFEEEGGKEWDGEL